MIPAHGAELPPSLVELAGSLLAQSRNRASILKADEEVARYYACANLACERYAAPDGDCIWSDETDRPS